MEIIKVLDKLAITLTPINIVATIHIAGYCFAIGHYVIGTLLLFNILIMTNTYKNSLHIVESAQK